MRAVDPAGREVAPLGDLDLEAPGLNEADAGKALVYAINAFVRSTEGDFTIRNLRDGFDAMLQETVARIADYRGALDTGAFQLAFQPIVRLSDRTSHHYEALSRPEDGAPIGSLVSFAEELNMVAEFDMMVCRRSPTPRRDGGGHGSASPPTCPAARSRTRRSPARCSRCSAAIRRSAAACCWS